MRFKGVGKLITILGLVFLSSFVFISCGEEEYSVNSISFKETEKIVLIVGDEYSPSVNILPSYASNKGYHFELMGNSEVLHVEGKKIIGVKEGTAQLKVIADDNEYLNDVISVKVLPSPIKLDAPSALRFDGNYISFAPSENATSYTLQINDDKLELQGRTSISLNECASSLSKNLYDKVLNIKVQAQGDSRITLPSNFSSELNVLKISSPSSLNIRNNILTFSKVTGVKEYSLKINQNETEVLSLNLKDEDFAENNISIALKDYIHLFSGGEYNCQLSCEKNDYDALSNVEVFSSNSLNYVFDCLSMPDNFKMTNNILTWDNVIGADYYSLLDNENNVLVANLLTNSYDLSSILENSKSYTYKVVAHTSKLEGVLSGLKMTDVISFRVLENPTLEVNIDEKVVEWSEVLGAVAYRVVVKLDGKTISNNLITGLSYDVGNLTEGSYSIDITACGNGTSTLTAVGATNEQFIVQEQPQNLHIENKNINWQGAEGSKYNLIIESPAGVQLKNEVLTETSYDLSGFVFESGEYTYTINCLAQDNKIASKLATGKFYKLEEIQDIEINDCQITFKIGLKTVATKAEYYKVGQSESKRELTKQDLNKYTIDASQLESGEYVISVFAFGNNKEIFDAENIDKTITITKLNNPSLAVDTINKEVKLSTEVSLANKYILYQNEESVAEFNTSNKSYSLNSLVAGSYSYKIKSIGNGKNILDSDASLVQVRVLRLATPNLTFDKTAKTFNITSQENSYVDGYNFTLDGEAVSTTNGVIDCSGAQYFQSAKRYSAKAYLLAKTTFGEYDLILNSDEASLDVNKISPIANLSIVDGAIRITPTGFKVDATYNARLQIGYKQGENYTYVDCEDLLMNKDYYSVKIIDENYNVVGPTNQIDFLFNLSNDFKLKWLVENSDNLTLQSNEYELGNIIKRDIPTNLRRSNDKVSFDIASGTNSYKLRIITDKAYYIDTNTTSIDIDELITKFKEQGLAIEEGITYQLEVIALGDDAHLILPSISSEKLAFKILNSPTATIKLNGASEKIVEIPCNVAGAESYVLTFLDSDSNSTNVTLQVDGQTAVSYPLSNVIGLKDGPISIEVKATNSTGNCFDSKIFELGYIALSQPDLVVNNGVLSWTINQKVASYTLYFNNDSWQTKTLTATDYTIDGDRANYDFHDISEGLCQIKMKAVSVLTDGQNYYYDSQDSDVLNVLKLSKASSSVVNGEIVFGLNSAEMDYIDKLIITNKQTGKEIDAISLVAELTESMTISPEKLLQYLDSNTIATENFELRVFAKNKGGSVDKYVLNSEILPVDFAGLKTAQNIKVETSINYEDDGETIDKISWENNSNNAGLTKGYLLEIVYKKTETDDPVIHSYLIEGENVNIFTFPNESDFGAGAYKIKIKVLASVSTKYLNSSYSQEYSFTLASTPKNLKTSNGKIVWEQVEGAGQYLVRVYDQTGTYLTCRKVSKNVFDFNSLGDSYSSNLYKVSVQAINENNPDIISSAISQELLIVKLPSINKYKLDMGNLYVYAHSFVDKIKLTLSQGALSYEFMGNASSTIPNLNCEDWNEVVDISSILTSENELDDHKYQYTLFTMNFDASQTTTIIDCLNNGYTLTLQALGNSEKQLATVDSSITNSASGKSLVNANDPNLSEENAEIERNLIKTKNPTASISSRGVVSWELANTSYTAMDYNGLKGLLLYNVYISVKGNEYNFLVADDVDINNLPDGVSLYVFGTLEAHTYYGYLVYNNNTPEDNTDDMYINILRYTDGEQLGALSLDFNNENIHFVEKTGTSSGNAKISTINILSGGNFDVTINVLGDSTIYLTSNKSSSKSVIRYQQLTLGVEDGYMVWKNLKTDLDSPIYLVRIKNTKTGETKLVYLYEESVGDDFTLPQIVDGATFKQAISYDEENIKFMLDTTFDGSYLFDEGVYDIDVITYYRDNTSLATIQAKASPLYTITKFKQIDLTLYQGNLYWAQTAISSTSTQIYDYEITAISDDTTVVFRIGQEDYTINAGMISYNLPNEIVDINGESFTFQEGGNYTFLIKALAKDNSSYINSNNSVELSTTISLGVTDVKIENNKLIWEYAQEGKYRIELTYKVGAATVTYIKETTNKYFELPSSIIDITGQSRTLTSEYLYNFRVMRMGSDSVLSSFYSSEIEVEKLKTLAVESITSNKGVLTWNYVTNLSDEEITDARYELIFVGDVCKDGQIVTSEIVDTNSFDFALYQDGEIKFSIVVHHNNYFKSEATAELSFYKFAVIENFVPTKDDNNVLNTLTWDSVSVNGNYADAYKIEVYDSENDQNALFSDTFEPIDKTAEKIEYNIAHLGIDLSDMRVRIKAVTELLDSNLLNGEWSNFYALTKAEEVDVSTFKINDLTIEWRAIDNQQNNDSYILQYYYKTNSSAISNEETIIINLSDNDHYRTVEDGESSYRVYFYKLYKVGVYTNIRITVNRTGSMSSNPVVMQEEGGASTSFNFDLFESGEGNEIKPYIIINTAQLTNINKFPSSYYELGQSINLNGVEGNIINTFTGNFNGKNYTLSNLTINSTSNYMGLFEVVDGATIENINLTYVNASLNTSYNNFKMYGGILAGKATNAIINSINIDYSTVSINISDYQNSYTGGENTNFYFGGLVGYIQNTTIQSCNIVLNGSDRETATSIAISGQTRDNLYFGTVAGYALESNILGNNSKNMNVSLLYSVIVRIGNGCTTLPNAFIGGVCGYMRNSANTDGIKYISVYAEQKQSTSDNAEILYHAGVCADIEGGTIQNVVVSGKIGANEYGNIFNSIYLGKLVAKYNKDVILLNNNVEGIELEYNSTVGKVNIVEI